MHRLSFFTLILVSTLLVFACKSDDASVDATKNATTQSKVPTKPLRTGAAIPAETKRSNTTGGLAWNSIDDLEKLAAKGDKKVMIDMYTSWCGWCKVMDKKTFTDPEVISYLNDNFHVIKFNAEQKQPIQYKGKTYEWVNAGRKGVNMLAHEMLNGRLGYPSMVYLDENLNKIKVSPGYKTPDKLLAELRGLEAI